MIAGAEHNQDLSRHVILDSQRMAWSATSWPGVLEKNFERITTGANARETGLWRLAAGARVTMPDLGERIELLVLRGGLEVNGQARAAGAYLRLPPGPALTLACADGADLLVKRRAGLAGTAVAWDTADRANWQPWGERGSEKVQLYTNDEAGASSWVGRMLPDLHIPRHGHKSGEEIFMLDGVMEDEFGALGPGFWVRFPVGLEHAPFSHEAGCTLLVREGDIVA